MEQNKFLKIFAAVMFVAFAAVSCWSTTESLFLTLESSQIPKWVFWIATIGLFVLTSYCTKVIVDCLNQNIYVERRKLKFGLGLLGMIVLWLMFSMPTNAHTFFYKKLAKSTAVKELTFVQDEFNELTNVNSFVKKYQEEWDVFDAKVRVALKNLQNEISSASEPGFGPKAEGYLMEVEDLFKLKNGTIRREKTRSISKTEINRVNAYYNDIVTDYLDDAFIKHERRVQNIVDDFNKKNEQVVPVQQDIEKLLSEIENNSINREDVLKQSRQVINKSYSILETSFIGLYEPDPSIYKSERLINVTKVWGDYLKGEFKGKDFTLWYWILLSIIVDLAAFVFFDIAFKKEV